MAKTILICGAGYIGAELARSLAESNYKVIAIKRTAPTVPTPKVEYLICDLLSERDISRLPDGVDEVVFCAAPSSHTEDAYREIYVDGMGNVIQAYESHEKKPRFVFTSSTGVYGQNDGSIVTESADTVPQAFSGRVVLEAEQLLRSSSLPWIILRLAGIYGPGRMSMLQRLRSGENLDQLSAHDLDTVTNRIHLRDCVGIIQFLIEGNLSQSIINGVDRRSVTRREIIRYFAAQRDDDTIDSRLPRASGPFGKRVSSELLLSLGYELKVPDFTAAF